MRTWTVYILRCKDDTYYTGCTSNFEARLQRHQNGHIHYTKTRLPVELVVKIDFTSRHKAYFFEKYLKSGSGRAFTNKHFL
ncbi:GIY-YIG nuclease family protein [Poritiphilus flavus]|uniref:GIY-YIG nuclease family protein n=1 Tax=Poritiphilus flavus TaxID=2697053 RepID=A0A6L9EI42_9FLAO|nr:GIY-YIG nuclease family protein [Poritiphilus flavus]NAS14353.1 GIY-YIG nuclease family protein [Poritiphilus flavus]